jgi:hypothetical protein
MDMWSGLCGCLVVVGGEGIWRDIAGGKGRGEAGWED